MACLLVQEVFVQAWVKKDPKKTKQPPLQKTQWTRNPSVNFLLIDWRNTIFPTEKTISFHSLKNIKQIQIHIAFPIRIGVEQIT